MPLSDEMLALILLLDTIVAGIVVARWYYKRMDAKYQEWERQRYYDACLERAMSQAAMYVRQYAEHMRAIGEAANAARDAWVRLIEDFNRQVPKDDHV